VASKTGRHHLVERTTRWVKNHKDDGAEHHGWWWCCAWWPGPTVGLWPLHWNSCVGHPRPWLGVVMERTHCTSLSDPQLGDASICFRPGLSPGGCRMGLRAPGETQPRAKGGGAPAVTAVGMLYQQCSPKAGNVSVGSSASAGFT